MNVNAHYFGVSLWLGFLLLPLVTGRADTLTAIAAADTFINSILPTNNAGALEWFDAGRDGVNGIRRGLIRFDLSNLPPGSSITSAVVQLTVVKVPSQSPINSTFDLFRLLAHWGEGIQTFNNGGAAFDDEATWNARLYGTAHWTEPGAKKDAVATPSASAVVGDSMGEIVSWSGPGLVRDVQFWLDNPASNYGWLLTSQDEVSNRSVRGFSARQSGSTAGRLLIGYIPGLNPIPFKFTAISFANSTGLTLNWSGGGGPFALQTKTNLADLFWTNAIVTTQRNVIIAPSAASGFFRILDLADTMP